MRLRVKGEIQEENVMNLINALPIIASSHENIGLTLVEVMEKLKFVLNTASCK